MHTQPENHPKSMSADSSPANGWIVSMAIKRWIRKSILTRAAKYHFGQFEELRTQWKLCVGWDVGGHAMPGWIALTEQQNPSVAALRTSAEAHHRAGMKIYRLLAQASQVRHIGPASEVHSTA